MTTRDAKEKALEIWGEAGLSTRIAVVFGLIASVWLGVTAAIGTVDERYLLRREHARYQDSLAASAVLRDVRDSARQERIANQLRYLICREDFSRQQCLRPDR